MLTEGQFMERRPQGDSPRYCTEADAKRPTGRAAGRVQQRQKLPGLIPRTTSSCDLE